MAVREASVETYLRDQVKAAGGLCVKLNPTGYVGIPDRLVVLPGGWIAFCEVKKPKGGVISRLQLWWRDELDRLGCRHRWVFTKDDVETVMKEWRER